ncbi:hypothetical protein [Streptomyces zhihengii]|uniref:Uncharacterized protein n=1 Tax=Streptomyces zhihengii TaxID=1818004 RepID=A0ABS2UXP0_9ACTN|nr:hypothetical protein [Streptomyces zhihengii]MBM9622124.1 hypothetical protein [Streptomyces zhihengii]
MAGFVGSGVALVVVGGGAAGQPAVTQGRRAPGGVSASVPRNTPPVTGA